MVHHFAIDGNIVQTFEKNTIAQFVPADGTRRKEIVHNNLRSECEVRSTLAVKML